MKIMSFFLSLAPRQIIFEQTRKDRDVPLGVYCSRSLSSLRYSIGGFANGMFRGISPFDDNLLARQ